MLWVWKGQTTKISCFVESSIKWYTMIFLVGCLNNRGLPIVRVQMIISWKVSARKLSPQRMNLFSKHDKQLVLFTVSFYRVVNIMFVFFLLLTHQCKKLFGQNFVTILFIFSRRLPPVLTPPHVASLPAVFHKCTSENVKSIPGRPKRCKCNQS